MMICNNCGKQIKDTTADKCLNCGQAISRRFEGNGFYDILSTKEEREKTVYHNEEKEQVEIVDDKLILEFINTHKATNKILKKQMVFKRITIILSVIFIAVSIIFLISFMSYSAKIDILNENLSKIHIPESVGQIEADTENNEVEELTPEEILYSVTLVDILEEQLDTFVKGKEIQIDDFVLGEIIENNGRILTVKANVIKKEGKTLLANNMGVELISEHEHMFSVDEISAKGEIKETE